jgi:glycosyltransferase involved in cell wall biosynthesis
MERGAHRKILMLCYYYPPLADVGCKRSVAFAKYLKKHEWTPYVVSVRNPDRQYCSLGNEKPPDGVPTTYARSLLNLFWIFGKLNGLLFRILLFCGIELKGNYFYLFFSIPDFFIGWVPGAIFEGYRIIKRQNIDYIYVSCTPYSSALAGMALKILTGRPLILDFRDPFYINIEKAYEELRVPAFRQKINRSLERSMIKAADIFIVNTEEVRQGYIRAYPDIEGKIFTVYNGFDHEAIPLTPPDKFEKFTIAYGGNMYFELIRSNAFFEAIAQLKSEEIIRSDNFQFLYFGQGHGQVGQIAREFGIENLISSNPSVPHEEMLDILLRAHVQLLRIVKPMISTKLFEGIALNIPFLATIPKGEVADIISRYSPSSRVVSEESAGEIRKAILETIREYRRGSIKDNYVSEFLDEFSREEMSRRLEWIIERFYLEKGSFHQGHKGWAGAGVDLRD